MNKRGQDLERTPRSSSLIAITLRTWACACIALMLACDPAGPGGGVDSGPWSDTYAGADVSPDINRDVVAAVDTWALSSCCPGGPGTCKASSGRILRCHPGGGLVETYPGNEAAHDRLDKLVLELIACARFKGLLKEILIVIAPPTSKGLEGLPEFGAEYEQAEGAALAGGLGAIGGTPGPPALVVASSSLNKWNLGATHELLHLLHHLKLTAAEKSLITTTYGTVTPNPRLCNPPMLPCNEYELFAYTGQWYLAGFGAYIKQKSTDLTTQKSAIHDMLSKILGGCSVSHGYAGLSTSQAHSMIDWVLSIYKP